MTIAFFKPKYYFILTKFGQTEKQRVDFVMYLKKGKFYLDYNLHSQYLFTWPQAMKYKFLFWWYHKMGNNEKLFGYKKATKVDGTIYLKKLIVSKIK